jgi:nitrate reductase gamma subunit
MILWLYLLMLAAQSGLWVLLMANPAVRSATLPADAVVSRILVAMMLVGLVLSVLGPGFLGARGSWFG